VVSFGSLLSAWQWVLVGLIPPALIALYFLKLKRQPLEVPSTFLWKKSIEDLHVNSLWQRMRQSLLLFLQLLIVAILALALSRPYWETTQLQGERFIFLVDNSASMATADAVAGASQTRLAEAKRRIAEIIDRLKPGDAAMIASFASEVKIEQQFTENRNDLLQALKAITQSNRTTSLVEALHVASGLANPRRTGEKNAGSVAVAEALPAELYIFSDGKFADVPDFSLGQLTPTFVSLGNPQTENLGITAFSVRRHDEKLDRLQAYFQIENFGAKSKTVNVELYLNDDPTILDTKQITVEPDKPFADVFDLADLESGVLKLVIAAPDAFPADNTAFAVVGAARHANVLVVTAGNEALSLALKTALVKRRAEVTFVTPDFLTKPPYEKTANAGTYDVIIYDRCQPKSPPLANTLFIGEIPPTGWSRDKKTNAPPVIDTDHAHPLMQAVEWGDVLVGEATPLQGPRGVTKLLDTPKGPIAAIAPREGYEDTVLGFELYGTEADGSKYANTNWIVKLSFPVFMLNAVNYLGGRADAQEAAGYRPGQTVSLSGDYPGEQLRVQSPSGRVSQIPRGKLGKFHFTGAEEFGVYAIGPADKPLGQFAVNLFDRQESDIRPRPENALKIGHEQIAGQTAFEPARLEGWRWLAVAALFLLLFEWYIFNRRVYL